MNEAGAEGLLENHKTLWFVSLLTIALFLFVNLPWQLEDYDQAKQAFSSWQVVKSGRWLYQETPGGKVATKPPLVGWISALLYEVTRSWEIAWRLPSLAAAGAIVWLLWRRTAVFGRAAALIALAAFSLNLLTPRLATLVRTDMPLALVTFLIALLFFQQIRAGTAWQRRERAALFLLLAASMLIKGPIVFAFVWPAMVLFVWRYRGDAILRSMTTGWWPWIFSFAIFVAWVVGGVETMPRFYNKVVLREFVGRFTETFHRPQPIFFYVPHLLHKWAPWSLLLVASLVADYRAARAQPATDRRRWWQTQLPPELFWLLAWGLGGLLVMSCIPSKRVDRIFPVVPPLCLLLGAIIGIRRSECLQTGMQPAPRPLVRWCTITLVAAVMFASSYAAIRIVSGVRKQRDALVKCGRKFRARAAENHSRYAVLKTSTEALVFYLDVPGFINESDALQCWKAGELDALIGSERKVRPLLPELNQGQTSDFCQKVKGRKHYSIVERR
jgi:4-amino-4-deoxy-L-arabinose transferase-like glycosyltransferase